MRTNILDGLTRRSAGRPPANPRHSPLGVQNRARVQVIGPDASGRIVTKHDAEQVGNVMATYGMSRLASFLAGGSFDCSDWIGGVRVGTDSTVAASTDSRLLASTGSQAATGANNVLEQGARTLRVTVSFDSNNPAGTYSGKEVGVYASSAVTTGLVARMDLTGANSYSKAASDTVAISYDLVFLTA